MFLVGGGYRKSLIRHCEARAARSGNEPPTVRACRGSPGTAAGSPPPVREPTRAGGRLAAHLSLARTRNLQHHTDLLAGLTPPASRDLNRRSGGSVPRVSGCNAPAIDKMPAPRTASIG